MRGQLLFFAIIVFVGCLPDNQSEPCDENTQILIEASISDHDLRMYPRATDSIARHIIPLPEQTDEANYKIEIYVGKMMEVDCNKHWLTGDFVEKTVDGWGYDYYKFNTEGQIMSTLVGCLNSPLRDEFVHGKSELVWYNSRLPIVVYAPKEYTVRYKLWTTNTHEYIADKE